MEKTSKRLEIMAIIQELFSQDDLFIEGEPIHDKIVYLMQSRLYPDFFMKPELQMAKELAKRAIAQATGFKPQTVNEVFKKAGDLGSAFGMLKQKGKQMTLFTNANPLLVSDVYNTMLQIANYSGTDSQSKKISMLSGLLSRCGALEAKYIGRFVDAKMRLGSADLTMIEAVARMLAKDEDDQPACREIIERAYNIYPDLGHVIKTAFLEGIDALKAFEPQFHVIYS